MDELEHADQVIAELLTRPGATMSRAAAHKEALEGLLLVPDEDLTTSDGQLTLRQYMIMALSKDDAEAAVMLNRADPLPQKAAAKNTQRRRLQ